MTTSSTQTGTQMPIPLDGIELPLEDRRVGKVRVSYALPNGRRLFVTTETLLKAMARAAKMGCSWRSIFGRVSKGYSKRGQSLNCELLFTCKKSVLKS